MGHPHTASTASCYRLDHYRVANFFRHLERVVFIRNDVVASRGNRHTGFTRVLARQILVAHLAHGAGWRPDKVNVAAFAHLGEVRVLCQESITGVDRIDIPHLRCTHDAIDFQITFRARRRANTDCFICQLHVE